MTDFEQVLDGYEQRIRSLMGGFAANPAATSADIARVEEIFGHPIPDDVELLYRRYNGGLPVFGYGWLLELPTSYSQAFDAAEWAAGAPFGFRDHLPLFRWDHERFDLALSAEHRGQLWRVEIDVDPTPVVRVAPNLSSLVGAWNRLIDDGVIINNEGVLQLHDDAWGHRLRLIDRYRSEINPFILFHDLSVHVDETIVRPLLAACGVDARQDHREQDRLDREIQAFLRSKGEGRPVPSAEQASHASALEEGMAGIIVSHLTDGGRKPLDPERMIEPDADGNIPMAALNEALSAFTNQYLDDHDITNLGPDPDDETGPEAD